MVTAHGSIPMAVDALQAGAYDFPAEAGRGPRRGPEPHRARGRAASPPCAPLNQVPARKVEAWSPGTNLVIDPRHRRASQQVGLSPTAARGHRAGRVSTARFCGPRPALPRPAGAAAAGHLRGGGARPPRSSPASCSARTVARRPAQGQGAGRRALPARDRAVSRRAAQTRLLRALKKAGGDVRVVAGTSHNLKSMVTKGRFRRAVRPLRRLFTGLAAPARAAGRRALSGSPITRCAATSSMYASWRGFDEVRTCAARVLLAGQRARARRRHRARL